MSHSTGPKVHVGLMILSLMIAVTMWSAVYTPPARQQIKTLKLQLEVQASNPNLVAVNAPRQIAVSFQGYPNDLKVFNEDNLAAYAQVRDALPGTREYSVVVESRNQGPPNAARFVFGDPLVKLTFESKITRKVEVTAETFGKLADPEIALQDVLVDPNQVTITGPRSQVEKITHASARLSLDTVDSHQRKPYFSSVYAITSDRTIPDLITIDPSDVKLTPFLSSGAQSKPAFVVPVITGVVGSGYQAASWIVTPYQVTLTGPPDKLASVTKIFTDPVDITGLTKSTPVMVNLRIPPGLTASSQRARVRIEIKSQVSITPNPPRSTPGLQSGTGHLGG